ncbi:glycoside hydrolase family 1 protein [Cryptosporangium aurantiacum]|uniref:Beta-glucosidase n=1 Tax=Cryptosporangium aurantiacum TaxID=134849 RepID=A0A1M7PC27_9ACTN|nr:family 1 glycosylhydrolase [Cryptosporangium aurantiacum]SHN14467.1 beta-glucosidase [Cryptosporangium aurantiacum]
MSQSLPSDFLWGASTAAHQIEGNNVAGDFWALEHAGLGLVAEPSGDACDSYHRWREDIDLCRDLGYTAYRFSIEWARIEPVRGQVSRAELAHYRRMIEYAISQGVQPVVTLHHFVHPVWFTRAGAWRQPDAVDQFARYVETVAPILDGVGHVVTMNEPNMLTLILRMGQFLAAPDPAAAMAAARAQLTPSGSSEHLVAGALPPPEPEVAAILVAAHERAREIVRKTTSAKVGWSLAMQALTPEPGYEAECARARDLWENQFLGVCKDDDFLGVQSYTTKRVGPNGPEGPAPGEPTTLVGWTIRPDALEIALRQAWDVTGGTPLLVTENGIATTDDAQRVEYLEGAVAGLQRAVADGIDVRGYLHWTLLDNYEWSLGYRPTFGLIAVDRETFVRTPKPSARRLGEIAAANGV